MSPVSSRRQLFGASAALLLLARAGACFAKAANPDADAELLDLAREFAEVDAQIVAWEGDDTDEDIYDPVHDRWWEIINRAAELPARSPAALQAKASIMPAVLRDCGDPASASDRFARSLMTDVLGRA